MMDIIDRLKTALHNFDPSIVIDNISLSFVEQLLPQYSNQSYLVVYKNVSPLRTSPKENYNVRIEEAEPRLDVTGSPLEYSFGKENFDDTIIQTKNNWRKEEETYLPLSRITASNVLNFCLANLNDKYHMPIFVLCDCKDNESTILICAINHEEWFTTVHVCNRGIKKISEITDECANKQLIREHRNTSSYAREHEINVSILSVFELFGRREDTTENSTNVKSSFEGSLSVVVKSHSLTFDLPLIEICDKSLVIQIVTGGTNSLLNQLWKQVILLDQYLKILHSYKSNNKSSQQYNVTPLEFPKDFSSSYTEDYEKTVKKLNLLLSGDLSFRRPLSSSVPVDNINDLQKCSLENVDIKLKEHIEHMFFRPDLDFTDYLWELLAHIKNHAEITDCLCSVFENILKTGYQPELNPTNGTRFVQSVSELNKQQTFAHKLVGSMPLELVIDMGFEKLTRDYVYLLMSARLINGCTVRSKLYDVSHGEYKIEEYRKRLITLAQIHVCVELALFVQIHLDCPTENLRPLFEHAFQEIIYNDFMAQSFIELRQNTIFTFASPIVNNSLIEYEAHRGSPSMWRASISSENEYSKLTTTTHYSNRPIFPPNICPPPSQGETDVGEEIFYASEATILSNKCLAA